MSDLILGFPTGPVTGFNELEYRLKLFASLGCKAIELHAEIPEIPFFLSHLEDLKTLVQPFSFVSFHAPVSSDQNFPDLNLIVASLPIQTVVIHPSSLGEYLKSPAISYWPIAVENLDHRNTFARTAIEIDPYMNAVPGTKLVLDLNHAFTNDPTLANVSDLLKNYGPRLSHFHASGFIDQVRLHQPLSISRQENILKAIPDAYKNKPIILELEVEKQTPETLKAELDYVCGIMNNIC